MFDALSMGHAPVTHARRARCPAHAGSIFNECVLVIVIVVWVTEMRLVDEVDGWLREKQYRQDTGLRGMWELRVDACWSSSGMGRNSPEEHRSSVSLLEANKPEWCSRQSEADA